VEWRYTSRWERRKHYHLVIIFLNNFFFENDEYFVRRGTLCAPPLTTRYPDIVKAKCPVGTNYIKCSHRRGIGSLGRQPPNYKYNKDTFDRSVSVTLTRAFQSDHRRGKRIAPMLIDLPGAERSRHRDHAFSRSSSLGHSVDVFGASSIGIRNLDRRMTSSNTNATVAVAERSISPMSRTRWPRTYPRDGPLRPRVAP